MIRIIQSLVLVLILISVELKAQTKYPYVMGYAAGEQVLHAGDAFKVSFSGGAPFATVWKNHTGGYRVMLGFKHDLLFVDNGFNKDMFVSKGYYSDFIELKWDLVRYASQVTSFKIYRKELGSSDDSVQVANLPGDARSWKDEYAESGLIYGYTLYAEGITSSRAQKFLNYIDGVGFRIPYGRISGRVTYDGGAAVPNVSVIAETDDNFYGKSLLLNGTNSYLEISPGLDDPQFKLDTAFTFQAWYKVVNGTSSSCLFEKQGQYKLTHSNGVMNLLVGGTQTLTLNFTQKADSFFNVTAIRTADSLKLIVYYDEYTSYSAKAKLTATTAANNNSFTIGKSSTGEYFNGYVDEARIWRCSFSERQAKIDASRYIAGTEASLSAYFRFNEGVGENFYDLSRKGFTFNEHHGYKSSTAAWSSVVPLRTQLSVKGITDGNGNYIISGIPYATDGTVYRFVPIYGIHSFEPTEKLLFIGPGSTTHSNVNFTDVASFPVTGEVYYRNTNYPVDGVTIKVDGQTVLNSDGFPISTDATGKFVVDVPIGKHYLELFKSGHGFENNGRFPVTEGEYFDFQQPYTFQTRFMDTTLIKVIGKVVGGPVQAAKPDGLGKTTNNLGKGKLILETQKGYDLTNNASGIVQNNANESYEGLTLVNDGTTKQSIIAGSLKQTEIEPDPVTGEYVAYLIPEKYIVKSVTAGTYTYPASFNTTLDLTNSYREEVEIDSVVTGIQISPTGERLDNYRIDSVNYNKVLNFIYRETPSVKVTNADGGTVFWETSIEANDGNKVSVADSSGNLLTPWPIFLQRNKYDLKISVFEKYINTDDGNKQDDVPVKDGKVEITNALAMDNSRTLYQINNLGEVNYKFIAGLPSIVGDYTQAMTISAYTGNAGSVQTGWPGNNAGSFKGYIFGGLPTGSNFVSTGPNQVDMILRDPYGSGSFAFMEKGNSVTKSSSYTATDENNVTANLTFHWGAEMTTWVGIGAGTIVNVVSENDFSVGMESTQTWVDGKSSSTTVTNTKTWQTSAEPDFVGANGDVFIGHSTNIVYGVSQILTLIPTAQCSGCVSGTGGYDIGMYNTIRLNPKFGTGFQYSQNHIKNYLIPNLKFLRNIYLQNSKRHQSVHAIGSDAYGSSNTTLTDKTIKTPTDTVMEYTGNSYSFKLIVGGPNANWPRTDSLFTDSVKYYNQQIQGWETLLARNEKEKFEAAKVENLSFDAGTVYSSSVTVDNAEAVTNSFEFSISPSIATKVGLDVMGVGFDLEMSETYTHTKNEENGTETVNTTTFGYTLTDTDEGDYFSIDVKKPGTNTGPVFAVRGGQSMCPHEGSEKTEYFQPGSILSEATMQREVPVILCSNSTQLNVPENKAALFNVQLGNASETKDAVWYMVAIDEATNQNGAIIKMDGNAIGNGRVIYIPAGATLNKVITIEKSNPAINDYEDIGIILRSNCQFDTPWPNISDTVKLTARFQPVCTGVEITSPSDLWVVNSNTGTELSIDISGYNLAHNGFEKIMFQYKPVSSSLWITDKTFYINQVDYDAAALAGQTAEWINAKPSLNHKWDMSSLQDRKYDIRTISNCSSTPENSSAIFTGIKDTKKPKVFGTPQPGDGILEPGDDVMITFDEPILEGLLLSSNFSVRGVLNGAELSHNSVLFFDGTDDYASAIAGVNLEDKDFTIEFWTKRASLTQGVIFQQADIEIGFNASNQLYVQMGSTTKTTSKSYNFTDKWIHFTVSFDHKIRNMNLHVAYDGYNDTDLLDENYNGIIKGNGKMYVGNNQNVSTPYHGYLHDLRVWEKTIGRGEASAMMNIGLNGNEIGLSGFWPMNESNGEVASDLSRSHHAILYGATWQVFPSGYARTFDGASNLDINTGSSVVITEEMDFTLEFWFKGTSQSNTVLFSNGKADSTEASGAFSNIWIVGFNASGKLYAKNNGTAITHSSGNVLDNEWHHLALVLKRKGNTSLYVDGALAGYSQSSAFGGLVGSAMTIGASRHYKNGTPYSNQLKGSMDELRIWKLARTEKLIKMDMNAKLKGDEKGLLAYYPFDKYDVNLILQSSLIDCDKDDYTGNLSGLSAIPNGGAFDNTNVPKIRDARPVQNLAFSWVVNSDKIIINIEEPAELIEKCVIEFTAERIEDLNENRLASPETWTAYINKNTIVWDKPEINFEKLANENLSFSVNIINKGGIDQNYTISNLPSWLTASSTSGTLGPNSGKIINFTVSPSVNIGNYDVLLYLASDFGYNEKLNLKLKVYQNSPAWNVNPSDYQYSMSVTGQVKIDGIFSTNTDDIVAAFVNGECRGTAKLQYVEKYDAFIAFLNIYSNVESGEKLDFKVWTAADGFIHVNLTPNLTFVYNTFHGTPSAPVVFESNNSYSREIVLSKGWNWVSFNINDPQLSDVNALFADVRNVAGDQIKGQTVFDNFGEKNGWSGLLSATNGFNVAEMYMVKTSVKDTVLLVGSKVNPLTTNITINQGWNWIGYVPQTNMLLADALSNYNASSGDVIKSQYQFAIYDANMGWIGSLQHLMPGAGYMYKSTAGASASFVFPNAFMAKRAFSDDEKVVEVINIDQKEYEFNMSLVGELVNTGFELNDNYMVEAFTGGICRGNAKPIKVNGKHLYFMTIYGYANDSISFKLINKETGVISDLNETTRFAANNLQGTHDNPFLLTLNGVTSFQDQNKSHIVIYPNPAKDKTLIKLPVEKEQITIELFDATGKNLLKAKTYADMYPLDLSNYGNGIYMLHVYSEKISVFEKIMVIK